VSDAYRDLAMQHPHLLLRECEVCATGVGSDGLLYVKHADLTIPCPAQCYGGRRLLTLEELLEEMATRQRMTPIAVLLLLRDHLQRHAHESYRLAAAELLLELQASFDRLPRRDA
jgi:hypothetical protein